MGVVTVDVVIAVISVVTALETSGPDLESLSLTTHYELLEGFGNVSC